MLQESMGQTSYPSTSEGQRSELGGNILPESLEQTDYSQKEATYTGATTLRIFLSPTRSGSTALLRCFENNPAVYKVYHQPIKSGFRQDGRFDYSFFEPNKENAGRLLVAKETVGGFAEPETAFSPLPNSGENELIGPWLASPSEIVRLEPLMLIRDPIQTWGSIERLNRYSEGISEYHSPFEYFTSSYSRVTEFMVVAKERGLPVYCVTQEMLAEDPSGIMSELCRKWDIPWTDAMINWTEPYGIKTWFSEEAKVRMQTDPRFKRSKEALEKSSRYEYTASPTDDMEDSQINAIETQLRPLYEVAVEYARQDFVSNSGE